MDLEVTVDADQQDLLSLYRWLKDESLQPAVRVSLGHPPDRPDDMGSFAEWLDIVVSNGIALGSLVVAVATWRESRSRTPKVRITHGETVVVVEGGSPEQVQHIIDEISGPADDSLKQTAE